MTKRSTVSVQKPIWYDAQQVDETDLQAEQSANDAIESAVINNHVGDGILPEVLVPNVLFDSSLFVGYMDGLAISTQAQPSDNNFGNQISITLTSSNASGQRQVKICVIGLDFQGALQYETFYFKNNEQQVSRRHFVSILVILFNDFIGDPNQSFNMGGRIVIAEADPMTLSRDVLMVAQDQRPNLFFRDFFLDPSLGPISLQAMLQAALPLYNITDLNLYTQPLDNLPLLSGDVTTQIGEKFLATTNNIQKVTLLLSVRNTSSPTDLDWTGDMVVSVYPLQSSIDCPTDFLPNLPIDFSPANIPLVQISYNYNTLQAYGIVLDSVPQPVDFVFSNSPIAGGNIMTPGQYYAVTVKRSGSANKCDILVAVGQDLISDTRATTFTGNLWVDITDEDLWFRVFTDAAKVSDGQAYDAGHGVVIPKVTTDPTTQATIDNTFGAQQFVGGDVFRAVLAAATLDSTPVPDQRTGNPIASRQQYVPQVTLMNSIDLTNLEKASEPLLLGAISDKNIKFFNPSQSVLDGYLFSATIAKDEMLIRVVDDSTDGYRYSPTVSSLVSNLLNGDLVDAKIIPDMSNPTKSYRIAEARLCSMLVGDVNGDGIIDDSDLDLFDKLVGYNLNTAQPAHTTITTSGGLTTFTNGYNTLIQPFANLFSISFQLVDPNTSLIVASGTDGVLVADPNDPTQAYFTSATVTFNTIIGITSYKLVVLSSAVNEANWGGWTITSVNATTDVITIQKIYLTGDTLAQMLRADIDGDFAVTLSDGYLLGSYIERYPNPIVPAPPYPAPTTDPYTKIGTPFNVIRLRLEEFIDRDDDYASSPATRALTVHPTQDIFNGNPDFASYTFVSFGGANPMKMNIVKQLVWEPSLVVTGARSRLVPSVFTYENGFIQNPCTIDGVQCEVYQSSLGFDPGRVDFFVPNNLVIGSGGELQRPSGDFYKVDFEVGTIVLEIPDGLYGTERTIDILNDFVASTTVNGVPTGLTVLGFPAMRFADCSFVTVDAIADDQIRFAVAVQSFSPNTNGLSSDGYYGAIVDGKMGVSIDFATGLLTLNFTNLYQDAVLQTLSTKVQVSIFLKKGGFNNAPLFVDSTKVGNMLKLISVFSGANVGGPSALVDLETDIAPGSILPIINGGTGLDGYGIAGTVLMSTGSAVSYQFVSAPIVTYTPATPADWAGTAPANVQSAIDRIAALVYTLNGGTPIP